MGYVGEGVVVVKILNFWFLPTPYCHKGMIYRIFFALVFTVTTVTNCNNK